jgi:hypothetical protein
MDPTPPTSINLLLQGLSDALGFLIGSALGWGLGQLAGLDLFEPGYSVGAMVAICLIGLGGGMGLQAARHWRAKRAANASKDNAQ